MITPDRFSETWPAVSRGLTRYLRSRGVGAADADDLVQECAVRVLQHAVEWDTPDDLARWCTTVVRNLHVDLVRRRGALPLTDAHEQPTGADVERDVTARLAFAELRRVWPQLSPRDRECLTDNGPAPADRKAAVRQNVARHRARQRLSALMRTSLSLSAVLAGLRRWSRPAAAGAVVAAGLATLVLPAPPAATTPVVDRAEQSRPAAASTPVRRVAAVPVTQPSSARPTQRPAVRVRPAVAVLPAVTRVQLATGDGAVVRHREARPDEPLVCVRDLVVSELCVDSPDQPTARAASTSPYP